MQNFDVEKNGTGIARADGAHHSSRAVERSGTGIGDVEKNGTGFRVGGLLALIAGAALMSQNVVADTPVVKQLGDDKIVFSLEVNNQTILGAGYGEQDYYLVDLYDFSGPVNRIMSQGSGSGTSSQGSGSGNAGYWDCAGTKSQGSGSGTSSQGSGSGTSSQGSGSGSAGFGGCASTKSQGSGSGTSSQGSGSGTSSQGSGSGTASQGSGSGTSSQGSGSGASSEGSGSGTAGQAPVNWGVAEIVIHPNGYAQVLVYQHQGDELVEVAVLDRVAFEPAFSQVRPVRFLDGSLSR